MWGQVLIGLLLLWTWGCTNDGAPADPTDTPPNFAESDQAEASEDAFWKRLPLPNDAEIVPVVEDVDLGFATGMAEPEVFDFYAGWLSERGWRQQAPTEAMVTLPHQVWRRNEVELFIEIRGLDEENRTVVWLRLEER
jgi:hypothetical protein